MKTKIKNKKGISLIVLIITIIVLVIIAGVIVVEITNVNIVGTAKNALQKYNELQQSGIESLKEALSILDRDVSESTARITVEDYGKPVQYRAGGVSDWRVFYSEGNQVYIIASDYLLNENLPEVFDMRKLDEYIVYWDYYGSSFKNESSSAITTEVVNKYKLSWLEANSSNTNYSARATADLLDVTEWTSVFGNASKGIEAIGAPTLEMWVESWNAMGEKYGLSKYVKLYTNTNWRGYYIGDQKNTTDTYYTIGFETNGADYTLYFPQQSVVDNCYGYWLASPSAYETSHMMLVDYRGDVSNVYSHQNIYALRPLVSIPAELIVKVSGGFKVKI